MLRLIGDVSHVDKIFIVDDKGSKVWSSYVPKILANSKCQIFAIQPISFKIAFNNEYDLDFPYYTYRMERSLDDFLMWWNVFLRNANTWIYDKLFWVQCPDSIHLAQDTCRFSS